MIKLTWWESFILQGAIGFLTELDAKITNATEKAALAAALTFLQKLVSGNVATD